jgi:hypothetical protein
MLTVVLLIGVPGRGRSGQAGGDAEIEVTWRTTQTRARRGFWVDADAERSIALRLGRSEVVSPLAVGHRARGAGAAGRYCFVMRATSRPKCPLVRRGRSADAAGHGSTRSGKAQTVPVASHRRGGGRVGDRAAVHRPRVRFRGHQTALFGRRLTFALVGALTVAVIGLRRVGGDRMGLSRPCGGYPELWINDGILMAESLAALSVAVNGAGAYRCADLPVIPAGSPSACVRRRRSCVPRRCCGPLLIVPMAVAIYRRRLLTAVAACDRRDAMAGVGHSGSTSSGTRPVLYSTNDGLTRRCELP